MSAQNDTQAAFMEAMNGLKEYAKVNGGFITKDQLVLRVIGGKEAENTGQLFAFSQVFDKLTIDFIKIMVIGRSVFVE